MKIYNSLSNEYNALYLENILQFQMKALETLVASKHDNYYVVFYPSFGVISGERPDFLVYGQAVNGWNTGFSLSDLVTPEKVEESIAGSNSYLVELDHCPLDWVNVHWSNSTYNNACVTYKLICDFYGLERSSWKWSRKLVWSNLYKIAPEDKNPDWFDRNLQQPGSCKLVQKEIEELNPKYCIVLTNEKWWKPIPGCSITCFS